MARGPVIRSHVKHITHIMLNLFRNITSVMELSDAIVHIGLALYIFDKPFLSVPRTAIITRRKSSPSMNVVCDNVAEFVDRMKVIVRHSSENLFQDIIQDKSVAFSLTDSNVVDELIETVRTEAKKINLVFHSSYCTESTKDVMTLHTLICYGYLTSPFSDNDDPSYDVEICTKSAPTPQCVHKVESSLKASDLQHCSHPEMLIPNPLKNAELPGYVSRQWKGWAASFSVAPLKFAEISRERPYVTSNQLSEAKFREWKNDPQYKVHCVSSTTMSNYWWNRGELDDKHYIYQMEAVQQIVDTLEV